MLWWSRRSGFGHLYLYDGSGQLLRQVTEGRFNVSRVVHVSEAPCVIYFLANGREEERNPYFEHLYRIGCDGEGLRLLTPENADHSVSLSPDGQFFVDNYSRPEHPTVSVLRNAMGERVLVLEGGTTDALEDAGWRPPLMFSEKAADGETDLWGVMWTPYDLDSTRHYPLVVYAYPGPQNEALPLTFMADPNSEHLAQYGFVVLAFGNRGGSQLRSVEYAEFGRGDMRDYALADKRYVVERLAERFPFIDLDRVGIWGGSSGGYLAAAAILTYPDFFKVAVARAGQHDPSSFDRWWNDWFQGMRRSDPPEGDEPWQSRPAPSNLELADRLQGHLLLIHGESDVVVHPSQSARLADALMSAGKRFDYWVVPGGPHGWSRHWRYMQQMIWSYFVRHLMGDERWSVDMFDSGR
jgi:dipeptidyl aminopeptidase/acylaminoacyl peptidase